MMFHKTQEKSTCLTQRRKRKNPPQDPNDTIELITIMKHWCTKVDNNESVREERRNATLLEAQGMRLCITTTLEQQRHTTCMPNNGHIT